MMWSMPRIRKAATAPEAHIVVKKGVREKTHDTHTQCNAGVEFATLRVYPDKYRAADQQHAQSLFDAFAITDHHRDPL